MALSRAAMNSGLVPLLSTTGGAASLPSRLSLTLTSTTSSCGSLAPAGTVQSCASRARNASSSLSDSCAAAPFDKPSEGALLSVELGRRWGGLLRRSWRLNVGLFRFGLLGFVLRQHVDDRIRLGLGLFL